LFTWGLFLCLTPFLWGKVSDPSAGPLLSLCSDDSLFVFQFCRIWVLLMGLGDDIRCLLPALPQAMAYHPPHVSLPAFQAICLLKVCMEISNL
jgi:hypothetical protein